MDWSRHTVLARSLKAVGVVAGTILLETVACGYPTPVDFNGHLSRWNIDTGSPIITYEVFSEDPIMLLSYKDVVRDSAGIWSSVHGSFADLTQAVSPEVAKISVHFDLSIIGGDSSAGYAEFDSSDEHGPTHCVIHIAAPTGIDWGSLAKTTLHELGHCLGLGHSVVPESIMSYRLDVNSFSLALDDEAAVARLYPADGSKPRKPAGCAIGASPSNHFKFLLFLLLLPPLAVSIRKRFFS